MRHRKIPNILLDILIQENMLIKVNNKKKSFVNIDEMEIYFISKAFG